MDKLCDMLLVSLSMPLLVSDRFAVLTLLLALLAVAVLG